jgi:hypothetical protein
MKNCSRFNCKQINPKPLTNFSKNKRMKNGLQSCCKSCDDEKRKDWTKNNPEKTKGRLLRKFWPNSTWEEALFNYNKLFKEQNGRCAICKQSETSLGNNGKIRDLSTDHSHITGRVRGLLCSPCNTAIGLLKDNIEILKSTIDYLTK